MNRKTDPVQGLGTIARRKSANDEEPSDEKMKRLTSELRRQTKEAAHLDRMIWKNLKELGYGED